MKKIKVSLQNMQKTCYIIPCCANIWLGRIVWLKQILYNIAFV